MQKRNKVLAGVLTGALVLSAGPMALAATAEYGTQRCFKLQHCGNHHTGKRVFPDILAVCVKDSGTDLNGSGMN